MKVCKESFSKRQLASLCNILGDSCYGLFPPVEMTSVVAVNVVVGVIGVGRPSRYCQLHKKDSLSLSRIEPVSAACEEGALPQSYGTVSAIRFIMGFCCTNMSTSLEQFPLDGHSCSEVAIVHCTSFLGNCKFNRS